MFVPCESCRTALHCRGHRACLARTRYPHVSPGYVLVKREHWDNREKALRLALRHGQSPAGEEHGYWDAARQLLGLEGEKG